MRITKIFDWHCAHLLAMHDGQCRNLHGHTYELEVEIEGKLQTEGSSRGMIVDFSNLKSIVKAEIFDKFDHALIVHEDDEEFIEFAEGRNWKIMKFPGDTTAENMAQWIFNKLREQRRLSGDFEVIRVRLYETDTSYAEVSK